MSRQLCLLLSAFLLPSGASGNDAVREAAQRVVKLYGAGGVGRIEAYGTGIVVSPAGHILTALSPMLHGNPPRVVLPDGQRFTAKLIATDMTRELAMLKIDADELPCWNFETTMGSNEAGAVKSEQIEPGATIYALSNLFGVAAGAEPVSVQRGTLAAIAKLGPPVRGDKRTSMDEVYIVDAATNNPGAAGGALIDANGVLLGILGKERQDARTGVWVNYALPSGSVRDFVRRAIAGESMPANEATTKTKAEELRSVDLRGIETLPEVIEPTAPFVDGVRLNSPAARASLRPDDLIMFVGEEQVRSLDDLRVAFSAYPENKPIPLTILRGEELVPLELPARAE